MQSAAVAAPTAETAVPLAWDDDQAGPSPETLKALAGLTLVRESLKEPRPSLVPEAPPVAAEPAAPADPTEPSTSFVPPRSPQLSEDEIVRALVAATAIVDMPATDDEALSGSPMAGPETTPAPLMDAAAIDLPSPLALDSLASIAAPTIAAMARDALEADERPPMIIEKAQAEMYGMEAPIKPIRFGALNPLPGFAIGLALSVASGALLFLALAPA